MKLFKAAPKIYPQDPSSFCANMIDHSEKHVTNPDPMPQTLLLFIASTASKSDLEFDIVVLVYFYIRGIE